MTKLPAVVTVSVFPDSVPVPVPPAMVKTTGLPEPPPVADSVIVRPGAYVTGAGCAKLMACAMSEDFPLPVSATVCAVPAAPNVFDVIVMESEKLPPPLGVNVTATSQSAPGCSTMLLPQGFEDAVCTVKTVGVEVAMLEIFNGRLPPL